MQAFDTRIKKQRAQWNSLYSLVYNLYNSTDKPSQVLRTWTQSGICTGVDFGGGLGMGNRFCHGYHDAVSCNHLQMHLVWKDPYETMSQVEQNLDPAMSPESHPRAPNGSWVFCHGGALNFVKCLTSQNPSFFLITKVQAKWQISIKSLFKLQLDFWVAIRCSIMVYCWRVTVTLRYTTRILQLLLHATTHGSR